MFNWNDIWKWRMLVLRRAEILKTEYWDSIPFKNENQSISSLTDKQLEMIQVHPEDTLLEIGPGYGRLTIPLAKVVKRVTVVEPSKNMLSLLRENAERNSVHNISFVNKRWEEVEVGKDVGQHDVVLASFSLLVSDLRAALMKMDASAKRAVYLFLAADEWMPAEIQKILYGDTLPITMSDHIIAYNLLYSMNIVAEVSLINYEAKSSFENLQEAVDYTVKIYNIPPSKVDELKEYLGKVLVEDAGRYVCARNRKVALIWWRKES